MSVQLPLSFRNAIKASGFFPEARALDYLEVVLPDRCEAVDLEPAATEGLVPRDARGSWASRDVDQLEGSGMAWVAQWQSIPARVLGDFGHRLDFHRDRTNGEWVFKHFAVSFDPVKGFEYSIEIRLDPAARTFAVRESFTALQA